MNARVESRVVLCSALLATTLFSLYGCSNQRPVPTNRQRPAVSQDGRFQATVSTRGSVWALRIESQDGMSLIDVDTDCLAQFNVYWIWDPENRFWIYNSDDGVVHCWWSDDPAEWHYVNWGRGHQKSTEVIDALPPDDLYPDYPRIE